MGLWGSTEGIFRWSWPQHLLSRWSTPTSPSKNWLARGSQPEKQNRSFPAAAAADERAFEVRERKISSSAPLGNRLHSTEKREASNSSRHQWGKEEYLFLSLSLSVSTTYLILDIKETSDQPPPLFSSLCFSLFFQFPFLVEIERHLERTEDPAAALVWSWKSNIYLYIHIYKQQGRCWRRGEEEEQEKRRNLFLKSPWLVKETHFFALWPIVIQPPSRGPKEVFFFFHFYKLTFLNRVPSYSQWSFRTDRWECDGRRRRKK